MANVRFEPVFLLGLVKQAVHAGQGSRHVDLTDEWYHAYGLQRYASTKYAPTVLERFPEVSFSSPCLSSGDIQVSMASPTAR